MRISIPDYLLEALLRHYGTLARAYRYDGDNRARNAERVADRCIKRVRAIIEKQKNEAAGNLTTGDN